MSSTQHRLGVILVGVDGSDDGLRAVDYAVAEARIRQTAVKIVNAVDLPGLFGIPMPQAGREALVAAGRSAAKAGLRRAAATGFPRERLSSETAVGKPADVLVELSRSAVGVVVGRRGLTGFERVFTGSTSTAVAAGAHCPVLVVPQRWRPPGVPLGTIGVGIDGSERSLPALAAAFEEASIRGAELAVLYAWEPPEVIYAAAGDYADAMARWTEMAELRMAEALAGWRSDYPDVEVRRRFLQAHPAAALIEFSGHLDLLFVGVCGHGSLRGRTVGTVARAVIGESLCPLALIRGPQPGRKGAADDARQQSAELLRQ